MLGFGNFSIMPAMRTDDWPPSEREFGSDDPAMVGDYHWCHLIPNVHRLLANPSEAVWFPRWRRDFDLMQSCAYWEAAYYVVRCLIGWEDPGLGFQRWFRQGREPRGDARLGLLRSLWDDHDQLILLAMWFWGRNGSGREPEAFLGAEFYASFLQRFPGFGVACDYDPYHGGGNALHLSHSEKGGGAPEEGAFCQIDSRARRAVLVVDHARNWRATLEQFGRSPKRGDHATHVDVFAKAIGWLGTFQQSPVTDLWFQGDASTHREGATGAAKAALSAAVEAESIRASAEAAAKAACAVEAAQQAARAAEAEAKAAEEEVEHCIQFNFWVESQPEFAAACIREDWILGLARSMVRGHTDFATAWAACAHADNLLMLASSLATTLEKQQAVIRAACACARTALHHIPAGEDRLRIAVEAAESWARGEASLAQVQAAEQGAWATRPALRRRSSAAFYAFKSAHMAAEAAVAYACPDNENALIQGTRYSGRAVFYARCAAVAAASESGDADDAEINGQAFFAEIVRQHVAMPDVFLQYSQ